VKILQITGDTTDMECHKIYTNYLQLRAGATIGFTTLSNFFL